MKKQLVILGGRGNALDIAETIGRLMAAGKKYKFLGHLDDDATCEQLLGKWYLGPLDRIAHYAKAHFIAWALFGVAVAVGMRVNEQCSLANNQCPTTTSHV